MWEPIHFLRGNKKWSKEAYCVSLVYVTSPPPSLSLSLSFSERWMKTVPHNRNQYAVAIRSIVTFPSPIFVDIGRRRTAEMENRWTGFSPCKLRLSPPPFLVRVLAALRFYHIILRLIGTSRRQTVSFHSLQLAFLFPSCLLVAQYSQVSSPLTDVIFNLIETLADKCKLSWKMNRWYLRTYVCRI